jgi:hypothetical protein
MEDMNIVTEAELESQTFKEKKSNRKPSGDDPYSDWLLKTYYTLSNDNNKLVRIGLVVAPFALLLAFSIFVSNATHNFIAFFALVTSLVFIGISMWMLCWILDKDQGSRAMQDVSDPIKEGAEGFFITQYGTIFKLAVGCSVLLFLVYLQRAPATGDS